jgi:hypothetical protein
VPGIVEQIEVLAGNVDKDAHGAGCQVKQKVPSARLAVSDGIESEPAAGE